MLLGGDEWMRTQLGNNNAYTTRGDNPFNWFDWGSWIANPARVRMHDFVRKLLRFRSDHAYAFAPEDYGAGAPFAWKSETGGDPNWDSKHIVQHYTDASRGPRLYILINLDVATVNFSLPQGVIWQRILDTQAFFEGTKDTSGNIAPAAVPGATYGAVGHSIVVLQAAP
jgi:glycogen operon protein